VTLSGAPFFELRGDDLVAVLDAAGSSQAALVGCDGGGPVAMLAAATYPHRVTALVLVNTFARLARADDYPDGAPPLVLEDWVDHIGSQWGGDPGFQLIAPSVQRDPQVAAQYT